MPERVGLFKVKSAGIGPRNSAAAFGSRPAGSRRPQRGLPGMGRARMGSGRLGRRGSRTHRRVERTTHRNAGRSPPASSLASCSVLDRPRPRRRPAGRALFPQPAVPENLLDHLGLVALDEGDDLHRRAKRTAAQRVAPKRDRERRCSSVTKLWGMNKKTRQGTRRNRTR